MSVHRQFTLLDVSHDTERPITTFNSSSAREAALKAASQGFQRIVLIEHETGKLNIFEGWRRDLTEKEHNAFTERNNIVSKPQVRKMLYYKFPPKVTLRPEVYNTIREICDG